MWHDGGAGARTRGAGDPGPVPGQLEVSRAAQKAVALAQQEKSTWTRADLIKYLGRVLPRSGMDPAAAAALLEGLADRALAPEFEPVACLEAPEPVQVPASLRRADGRSVYQRHGGVRFATHAQLSMEQRMVALARASGAPRMDRGEAARALGADLAQLDRALADGAPDAHGARTRTGLRVDQAAAALSVLTDGRRVSVINAPAGSGKTWVLTAAGRAWAGSGLGRVIGITPSQSARNTLAAGVPVSYNCAQFLGHLPGQRGARGPVRLRPGDVVLMDEASMVANPDLADVVSQAAASGAKVILAGDTQQLQAVENGGGLSLLAGALGFVQLAEPVRFRAGWERAASLRLREGDTSVLAEYDQHARITGGEPEQMMDAAAAHYLALDADPRTGRRRWTGQRFRYAGYRDAELGYAVTDHVAQSRTVHTGLGVIAGTEDRQHAYVVLSRGTEMNMAYVFTVSPKRADPAPGPRPAPELARYDRITGEPAAQPAAAAAGTRDALGVLSGVLDRDGQQLSASQTRQRALANADHLAILNAIWTDQTTPAREQHYRDLLLASLPPEHRRELGHQARWLWRTIRAAELADLDAGQVLAAAIAERDLAGARDLAAVIDARLRYRTGALIPAPAGPWSAQVPAIADPERHAYLTEIVAMMDARKDRIGEHAAEHTPPWAVATLGPVPEDPLDRLNWQKRASSIGAWRELSGHCDPADPIGPEPVAAAPDMRAAWHEALAALGPADGPDVRGMPDGRLLHLRDTYPIETAWAPQYVGDELRQVRAAAREAHLAGLCASTEATAAAKNGHHGTAARQQELAASYQALHEAYQQRETVFATIMADRADWTPPPAPNATWPSPPTPNCAAATPISTSPRSARPNPNPPPTASEPSSP